MTQLEPAASESYYDLPFEEQVKLEKEYLERNHPGVPYVIFKKKEYHDDQKARGRVREVVVAWPFLLNGCHGDVENVARFERRGWPIVDYGNLHDQDKDINTKLQAVAAHCQAREVYMNMKPEEATGILAKKQKREKEKAESANGN